MKLFTVKYKFYEQHKIFIQTFRCFFSEIGDLDYGAWKIKPEVEICMQEVNWGVFRGTPPMPECEKQS